MYYYQYYVLVAAIRKIFKWISSLCSHLVVRENKPPIHSMKYCWSHKDAEVVGEIRVVIAVAVAVAGAVVVVVVVEAATTNKFK